MADIDLHHLKFSTTITAIIKGTIPNPKELIFDKDEEKILDGIKGLNQFTFFDDYILIWKVKQTPFSNAGKSQKVISYLPHHNTNVSLYSGLRLRSNSSFSEKRFDSFDHVPTVF